MMMGVGILFMLAIALVVIGIPLLVVAFIAGWLPGALKPQAGQPGGQGALPGAPSLSALKCPACGRSVKADWNVCPSCGTALA